MAIRYGIVLPTPGELVPLSELVDRMVRAEQIGLDTVWMPHIMARGYDALTTLALAGMRTSRIELGTWVVPTFPRHPFALAQQALTTQAATNGRLLLGIGLSHRVSIEGILGFDFSHPVRHLREYLTCLLGLLAGETVTFKGEEYTVNGGSITVPNVLPPPVMVAALGPQMLRLTGQMTAGTLIWMGGERYLADHVLPTIAPAAAAAGRPAPRVQVAVPFCVTDRAAAVREEATTFFARYGQLPSYRAILDKAGAAGPQDVALIGDEETVLAGVRSLAAAGATDIACAVYAPAGESADRTWALLERLARRS